MCLRLQIPAHPSVPKPLGRREVNAGRRPGPVWAAEAHYEFSVISEELEPTCYNDILKRFECTLRATSETSGAPAAGGRAVGMKPDRKAWEPWTFPSNDEAVLDPCSCCMLSLNPAPDSPLSSIMKVDPVTAHPHTPVVKLAPHFASEPYGVPVVLPKDGRLIGVVCKDHVASASPGALVHEVMAWPPVAAQPHSKLQEAACIMVQRNLQCLPVVDRRQRCVGMVTRSDICSALGVEGLGAASGVACLTNDWDGMDEGRWAEGGRARP